MTKWSATQNVIYRESEGAINKTGTIKRLGATDSDGQTYVIKPDDGGSDVVVKEIHIVKVNDEAARQGR